VKKKLSICAIMAISVLTGCSWDKGTGPGSGPGQKPEEPTPTDHFNPKINYGSMTDPRDGKTYKTTVIDGVTWMAENLNYDMMEAFEPGTMPFGCYDYASWNCEKYGRLYRETQRIDACPVGWRLPDTADAKRLLSFVDSVYMEKFMATGKSFDDYLKAQRGWRAFENGTDDFGFSALPGGNYYENRDPKFEFLLYYADFWTSTDKYFFRIGDGGHLGFKKPETNVSLSIRCIKNN
jgi:uncharacterized protein (TIGR02145 family)